MVEFDPKEIQYEIVKERIIPEIYPMPLEIMQLLGIAKEIKKKDTKDDEEK